MTRTTQWAAALAAAALLAALSSGVPWRHGGMRRGASMQGWQVEDLVGQLRRCGLDFRALPAHRAGPLRTGAYLTTTDKTPEQVGGLGAAPERIADWEGTVFCDRYFRDRWLGYDARMYIWGDCCLRVGPFLLFGDRDFMARIRDALQDAGFCTD